MTKSSQDHSRVVVVTGAGSGVGAATAARFHAAGYRVALLDRDEAATSGVAAALDPAGETAIPIMADVTGTDSVEAAINIVAANWRRVDVLVNNAGVPHAAVQFEALDDGIWTRAFEVNVVGIARMAGAALPLLKTSRGSIVNVTSVAGSRARAGLGAYCASKAAAISLTQTMALELAEYGIRVNSIAPGALATPMFGAFLRPGESLAAGTDRYEEAIPLHRLGQPAEVADAIFWAAGDQAEFMTGQTIVIDGGRAI